MAADAFDRDAAAARHGLSRPAAEALFQALVSGGGLQAQFNHPDLGGLGQWSGGMVQIGDMFNDGLKGRIAAFCAAMTETARTAQGACSGFGERAPERDGAWWPSHLGHPASSGAQNGLRYACFPEARRLAVARDGAITLYDTGDRRLTGFAQQQGWSGAPLRFSGPDGAVALDELSVVEPWRVAVARPVLVSFSGLPGSGKSTLSRRLAKELSAIWLRIDSIEQVLRAGRGTPDSVGDAGYRVAHAVAADNVRNGLSVVADCVNPWMLARDAWRDTARAAGADIVEVEIICSDPALHRSRVEGRMSDIPGLRLPDWADVMERDYQPWTRPCLRIDTASQPIEESLDAIRRAIAVNKPA